MTSEEFKARYQIVAVRTSLIYDRGRLRAMVRRAILVPELMEEALALIDNDEWMRRRRGMSPGGVVHEVLGELFGYGGDSCK